MTNSCDSSAAFKLLAQTILWISGLAIGVLDICRATAASGGGVPSSSPLICTTFHISSKGTLSKTIEPFEFQISLPALDPRGKGYMVHPRELNC